MSSWSSGHFKAGGADIELTDLDEIVDSRSEASVAHIDDVFELTSRVLYGRLVIHSHSEVVVSV